jgi:ribulose 1,5-bisphosphate carboxylase large subunit-like protein
MQSSGGKAGAETVRAALAAALSAQPMTPAVARTLETQPGAVLQVSVLYSDRAVE